VRGAAPRETLMVMFSTVCRQNLHARRPTAPRWIAALIETCAGGVKGECGAQHEGCRSARACAMLSPTAMDNARSCGTSRPDAKHSSSTTDLVRLHPQNAHSSALLARWAGPTSTAVTARSGAPFAQTVSLFLQRALSSRRIPAPTGAITRSPAQRRKILSSPSRGSQSKGKEVAK